MDQISRVGLDIAKQIFHVVAYDEQDREVRKRMLRRTQVMPFFAQLPPCRVGIEACASAHHWARQLTQLGHEVTLLPAQHIKPYLRGNKNDYNDARAIAEAMTRPGIRPVAIKTPAQQDQQAVHRLRQGLIQERTAAVNRLRGLLSEYGIVIPRGISALRRRLPALMEEAENGLSMTFRGFLAAEYAHLKSLDAQIKQYEDTIKALARQEAGFARLLTIPGFGPISASAFVAYVHDPGLYRRGRDVAAALGLVPRQHSSGGKERLLGISKRGDAYLRTLLVHGARAVVRVAEHKEDPLSRWVNVVRARRGIHKATVALANKMARMGWAILAHGTHYQARPAG